MQDGFLGGVGLEERQLDDQRRLLQGRPRPERHDFSDEAWNLVKPLLPGYSGRGPRPRDNRTMLSGMMWILRTGSPWRDLPESRFGPWETVYSRFRRWRSDGTLARVAAALVEALDERGEIDWDLWCVDGSSARATRAAAGAAKRRGPADEPADHGLGRSRGGLTSKFHLVVDGKGQPLGVVVSAGQRHDSAFFEEALDSVPLPARFEELPEAKRPPKQTAADKAYSSRKIRMRLEAHGVQPVIPRKGNEKAAEGEVFNKEAYKRRNVVERCIGWLKECRRVATRYEKLAVNFLAMVRLAMIERYLRVATSST